MKKVFRILCVCAALDISAAEYRYGPMHALLLALCVALGCAMRSCAEGIAAEENKTGEEKDEDAEAGDEIR